MSVYILNKEIKKDIDNIFLSCIIFSMLKGIYSLFCHQQLSRSLVMSGHVLPLCARCTGIYLGFLIGFFCFTIVDKKWGKQVLSRPFLLGSSVILLVFVLAAMAESFGWMELSNNLRFFEVLFAGSSIGCVLFF